MLSDVPSLDVTGVGVCVPRWGCPLAQEAVVGDVDGRRGSGTVGGGQLVWSRREEVANNCLMETCWLAGWQGWTEFPPSLCQLLTQLSL